MPSQPDPTPPPPPQRPQTANMRRNKGELHFQLDTAATRHYRYDRVVVYFKEKFAL